MTDSVQETTTVSTETVDSTDTVVDDGVTQADEASSNDSIDSLFSDSDAGTDTEDSTADNLDESASESPDSDVDSDQEQQTSLAVEDIAASLGLKPENFVVSEDGTVLVKAIVDGKPDTVTPEKLLASYQYQKHLDNKSMEVNKELQAVKEQQTQSQQQFAEKLQQAEDITNIALQELYKDFSDVNWEELKQYDDGQYANKRELFRERQSVLQQNLQAIQKQRDEAFETQVSTITAEANKKLVEAFPAWSDPDVGKTQMTALRTYGIDNLGFDKKIMEAVSDHRIFQLLDKAQKYDALEKSKPEVKNLVRRAVKVTQAGKQKQQASKSDLSNDDFFYGSGG